MRNRALTYGSAAALAFAVRAAEVDAATTNIRPAPTLPTATIDVMVHLPLRDSTQLEKLVQIQTDPASPLYHHFLSAAQFHAAFAPSDQDVAAAISALRSEGMVVTGTTSQLIIAHGPVSAVERAFSTRFASVRNRSGLGVITKTRGIIVPPLLAHLGAQVITSGITRARSQTQRIPENRVSKLGGYWFDDLKQAYQYPSYTVANGRGVTIATVGLSDFSTSDDLAYFHHEKLGSGGLAPAPTLTRVLLPGGSSFDPTNSTSQEADLDTQQAGGSAPGATIQGVSIGGTSEPFLQAFSYIDEQNIADIVSTSYGGCELYYTAAYPYFTGGYDESYILRSYHDLFRQGNSQGITFVTSSGDDSGLGCLPPEYFGAAKGRTYRPIPGANSFADDPSVTAVGGTNLLTTYAPPSLRSTYVSENEVGDRYASPSDPYSTGNQVFGGLWGSGDGVSVIFTKPSYQNLIKTGYAMRSEPDISMHMGGCPGGSVCDLKNRDSYDYAIVGGKLAGFIGTSASAPEFAGLLAVEESKSQPRTRLGNVNLQIYTEASRNTATGATAYFHQGIPAYNGIVRIPAGQLGYNLINGVGTPIAQNFALQPSVAPAGDPQTPTNP